MDAIFQTLLGGVLALAGAIVGPFLQRRHDRWLADKQSSQLIREKAQELFDELDRLVKDAGASTVRAVELVKDETLAPIPVPDLGRMRSISAIYFPDCIESVKKFEKKSQESNKAIVELIGSNSGTLSDPRATKMLVIKMVSDFQKTAGELASELRDQLSSQIPPFKESRSK